MMGADACRVWYVLASLKKTHVDVELPDNRLTLNSGWAVVSFLVIYSKILLLEPLFNKTVL